MSHPAESNSVPSYVGTFTESSSTLSKVIRAYAEMMFISAVAESTSMHTRNCESGLAILIVGVM